MDEDGKRVLLWEDAPVGEEGEIPKMYDRQGRHPHLTFIDSHVNAETCGVRLNNVKYFHFADILFYARNDKNRDERLVDVHCIDCHSGFLANGYSGGAVGNEDKKPVPAGYGYELDQAYIDERG